MFKQKLVHCSTALALVAAPIMLSVPLSGWAQIEEIVVTARKREENLQEIPLAVEVFGREEILRKGINTIDQVALLSASLGYESAAHPEAQKLSIRGINPSRGRQNMAILIDGIDISSESMAQNGFGANLQQRFLDIERIELVKGPQSALYGRSAFNGALQYVSMEPAEELEGDFLIEGGEFDRYSFRGSLSGPMSDRWGYRLNAAAWDEGGFYTNSRTGDKIGGADGWGGAVTLKWEPTERWGFKFRGSYTDQDREPPATILIPHNFVGTAPPGSCIDQFPDDPANPNTAGVQQVFTCDIGQTFDAGFGLSAITTVGGEGGGRTYGEYLETIANPNGTPLQAGPVTATNQPIGFSMGNMTDGNLRTQHTGVMPGGDELGPVALDPDPRTGKDFPGSNIKETRFSLIVDYAAEKWTFKSWTGYADAEMLNEQDWQQAGDWAQLCGTWIDPVAGLPFLNGAADVDPAASCNLGYNKNFHQLEQFSQEFRWASNFDGWQQATLGVQYWDDARDFSALSGTVRSRNFECAFNSADGAVLNFPETIQPICGIFSIPIDGATFQASLDDRARIWNGLLDDVIGTRETEHTSAYFLLETNLSRAFGGDANKWTFTFEGRFNKEKTNTRGIDSSASGSTGADLCGGGPIQGARQFGDLVFMATTVPPLTPAVPVAHSGNSCSGQAIGGWAQVGPFTPFALTGGPPNLPWQTAALDPVTGLITANGYDVPPCAMVDLTTVSRDPRPIVDNCGVGSHIQDLAARAAFQRACTEAIALPQSLTADNLQAADANGNSLGCFETFHNGSTDANWFTPKVSLQWAPRDEIMFYLSWARGEKPPGHTTLNFGSSGFDPVNGFFEAEVMDVTEFGWKTALANNTVIFNGAIFFQDYTDKQVNTQIVVPDPVIPGNFSTSPQTINASGAEIPGLEFDVAWAPAFEIVGGNLLLQLSYTYLDAEYTDYASLGSGSDTYSSRSCIPDPIFLPDAEGGPDIPVPQCIIDRSGNTLEDAPEHSAIISGRYEHLFFGGGASWYFEFDTTYRDKTFVDDVNTSQMDAWWNTNIRLGWRNERYEAVFFVNNVADDDTMMTGFTTPGLVSSFIFSHARDTVIPPVQAVSTPTYEVWSMARGGPEFNSNVAVGSLRTPRHWGIRFRMRFGGDL